MFLHNVNSQWLVVYTQPDNWFYALVLGDSSEAKSQSKIAKHGHKDVFSIQPDFKI